MGEVIDYQSRVPLVAASVGTRPTCYGTSTRRVSACVR